MLSKRAQVHVCTKATRLRWWRRALNTAVETLYPPLYFVFPPQIAEPKVCVPHLVSIHASSPSQSKVSLHADDSMTVPISV